MFLPLRAPYALVSPDKLSDGFTRNRSTLRNRLYSSVGIISLLQAELSLSNTCVICLVYRRFSVQDVRIAYNSCNQYCSTDSIISVIVNPRDEVIKFKLGYSFYTLNTEFVWIRLHAVGQRVFNNVSSPILMFPTDLPSNYGLRGCRVLFGVDVNLQISSNQ